MSQKINELEINGETYVLKSSQNQEVINFTGEETISSISIGKKVICRTRNEGVNAGIVVLADETGVVLKDCRRIWYHKPKDKSVSWYEGIAETGISDDSKVSCTVSQKVIIEDYSLTICKDDAFKTIMELRPNAQN